MMLQSETTSRSWLEILQAQIHTHTHIKVSLPFGLDAASNWHRTPARPLFHSTRYVCLLRANNGCRRDRTTQNKSLRKATEKETPRLRESKALQSGTHPCLKQSTNTNKRREPAKGRTLSNCELWRRPSGTDKQNTRYSTRRATQVS